MTKANQDEVDSRHKAEEVAHEYATKVEEVEQRRQEVEADLQAKLKVISNCLTRPLSLPIIV